MSNNKRETINIERFFMLVFERFILNVKKSLNDKSGVKFVLKLLWFAVHLRNTYEIYMTTF